MIASQQCTSHIWQVLALIFMQGQYTSQRQVERLVVLTRSLVVGDHPAQALTVHSVELQSGSWYAPLGLGYSRAFH